MSLASNEFIKAVYTRLNAQITTVPIYDYVPPSSVFPYISFGAMTSIDSDNKSHDGQEFTLQIHVYDKAAGKKTTNTIMQNVYSALHHYNSSLAMTGFECVFIRCEFSEISVEVNEGDGDHYQHGVMRFRALITTN